MLQVPVSAAHTSHWSCIMLQVPVSAAHTSHGSCTMLQVPVSAAHTSHWSCIMLQVPVSAAHTSHWSCIMLQVPVSAAHTSHWSCIMLQVPVSAAHAYDAVLMYARALTEVLAAKEDPTNGTAVLQRIRGHNFMSLRGYMVRARFLRRAWVNDSGVSVATWG